MQSAAVLAAVNRLAAAGQRICMLTLQYSSTINIKSTETTVGVVSTLYLSREVTCLQTACRHFTINHYPQILPTTIASLRSS
jgi:hypothetical protein